MKFSKAAFEQAAGNIQSCEASLDLPVSIVRANMLNHSDSSGIDGSASNSIARISAAPWRVIPVECGNESLVSMVPCPAKSLPNSAADPDVFWKLSAPRAHESLDWI